MRRPFVFALFPLVFAPFSCTDRPVAAIVPKIESHGLEAFHAGGVDKVDLLVVVDNSSSMADKQSELGRRIPELVSSLIAPEAGKPRVDDLHVAVITSSLGAYGTDTCPNDSTHHGDDHGHLLPRTDAHMTSGFRFGSDGEPVAAACPKIPPASVLSWSSDPKSGATFVGDAQIDSMEAAASCVVASAGEDGCGFESTLEAAYRFLVDPAPYATATAKCDDGSDGNPHPTFTCAPIATSGVDQDVLNQRKAFLRDDSLLAVVFITDENDSSFDAIPNVWEPQWLASGHMQRAWGGCAKIADDVDTEDATKLAAMGCKSCEDDRNDPACSTFWPHLGAGVDSDQQNLRAFEEIERFGKSWLFPRQRYVDAFSSATITIGGKTAPNPLFAKRSTDQLVVAAITGVPKTLVDDASGAPKSLAAADWSAIADADPTKRSPYMIESITPRAGIPKYAHDRSIDPVNGGDRVIGDGADLEYACIAPRSVSTCDGGSCECKDANDPLCDPDFSQPYFKAYPGLRQLRILRDVDAKTHNAFVASICDTSYAPAVRGIVDKLRAALSSSCTEEAFHPDPNGAVPCAMFEVLANDAPNGKAHCEDLGAATCTPGSAACRSDGASPLVPLSGDVTAQQLYLPITTNGKTESVSAVAVGPECGVTPSTGSARPDCDLYVQGADGKRRLVCELRQIVDGDVSAATKQSCLTDPKFDLPAGDPNAGWCYATDPAVLATCSAASANVGTLRFLGDAKLRPGADGAFVCP